MENPLNWKIIEHQGKKMHEGVHALIQKDRKLLLVERRFPPFGFAFVAGHVDKGEDPETALVREVSEEIRTTPSDVKFLYSTVDQEGCFLYKHWSHIFSCEISCDPILNFESKSFGWFAPEKVMNLKLTKMTREILEHLHII